MTAATRPDPYLSPDASVAAFVRSSRREAFAWGAVDCCLWPADYVRAVTGQDPAADLRGSYDSRFGARRILMAAGGLRSLWTRRLAGFPEGRTLVLVRHRGQVLGGLCAGPFFFCRAEQDVLMTREFDLLQGWGLPCPRL